MLIGEWLIDCKSIFHIKYDSQVHLIENFEVCESWASHFQENLFLKLNIISCNLPS